MRWTRILIATLTVIGGAASSSAQTITVDDVAAARAGLRIGYGGRGVDWETSIDSPLLAGIGRFRASLGVGRWVGIGEVPVPAGGSPWVTRVAGSAIVFLPPRPETPNLRPYLGIGISGYLPMRVNLGRQRGARFIAGLESSGDRWDVGPEVEVDLPRPHDELRAGAGDSLIPTVRIGIAIRRRF